MGHGGDGGLARDELGPVLWSNHGVQHRGGVLEKPLTGGIVLGSCHRGSSCSCSHLAISSARRSHPAACPSWLRAGLPVVPWSAMVCPAGRAVPQEPGLVEFRRARQARAVVEREPGPVGDVARQVIETEQRRDNRPALAFLAHPPDGSLNFGVRRDLEPARDRDHVGRRRGSRNMREREASGCCSEGHFRWSQRLPCGSISTVIRLSP
jgi:hypothetical protein